MESNDSLRCKTGHREQTSNIPDLPSELEEKGKNQDEIEEEEKEEEKKKKK